ncbi:hypothetical protein [uncultured Deinococcus sp.]|uniref:hypothetical protein n=1 Tax=uncultured Deinococcus sp. TaxID=158789 RepID=UPI00258FBF7B|nr:hypothetical protein [uncultured Deinococcus sp.]
MKKLALIIPAISIALASCGVAGPTMSSYTLSRPATVQSLAPTYSPAGTVSIGQVPGVTRTTITMTGLAPFAVYTAQYFTPGTGATTTTTTTTAATTPAAAASTTVTNPTTATAGTSVGGAISGGTLATGTTSTTDMAAMTTTTTVATSGSVCSGGMAIATSRLTGQADKDGKLSLDGFIPTAALSGAAYLNVQGASDFAGTPSDSGVLCTAVSLN